MMCRGGTLVSCGASAGGRAEIDVRDAYLRHKRIVGSTMGIQGDLKTVLQFVADGRLEPAVGNEYALENLDDAFRDMRGRDLFGKACIVP